MHAESKKLHLIEEMLKISNNATLIELDNLIKKAKRKEVEKSSFKNFSGIWSVEEAEQIERTINDSCEKINPDDWK